MENQFTKDSDNLYGHGTKLVDEVTDQVKDAASQVRETVAGLGRKTIDRIDWQRESAADTLGQTASGLHRQADRVADVAHATADKFQATADYVRNTDFKNMTKDVENLVRRYPGQSLALAALAGLLVARAFWTRA